MNVDKHQAELDSTTQKKDRIVIVENSHVAMQKDYDSEKELRKKAEDGLNDTRAQIEIEDGKKLTFKRTLKSTEASNFV